MENAVEAAYIRGWMRGCLKESGLTPAAWAKRAGVAASTIQRALRDDYPFVTSSRTLARLAAAIGAKPPRPEEIHDFLQRPDENCLPVRHVVQAGNWFEVDNLAQVLPDRPRPVCQDPRFEGIPQWLERVEGDSVDLLIPPGGYAHVVDAVAIHYTPRKGDPVVIERRRNGGHLRERTIKVISIQPNGPLVLMPASSNPRWSSPIDPLAGTDEQEIEVQIMGLVIGAYLAF